MHGDPYMVRGLRVHLQSDGEEHPVTVAGRPVDDFAAEFRETFVAMCNFDSKTVFFTNCSRRNK